MGLGLMKLQMKSMTGRILLLVCICLTSCDSEIRTSFAEILSEHHHRNIHPEDLKYTVVDEFYLIGISDSSYSVALLSPIVNSRSMSLMKNATIENFKASSHLIREHLEKCSGIEYISYSDNGEEMYVKSMLENISRIDTLKVELRSSE